MDAVTPKTLIEFFVFLASPTAIGAVFSFLVERFPLFQGLTAEQKSLAAFVVSAALGIASYLLVSLVPSNVISQLDPVYGAMISAFVAFWSSQKWHAEIQKGRAPPAQG